MSATPDGVPRELERSPDHYRHWRLSVDGRVARLVLAVDEAGALAEGVVLKRNSYDQGVDLELRDAVQRLRFEHPEVGCVLIESALAEVFCAGANIGMLARASHPLKVNFCKLTNETRLEIEDATRAGQRYVAVLTVPPRGGGYERALDW
jgi:benzoyl-CoA-dihydrodiol lyase